MLNTEATIACSVYMVISLSIVFLNNAIVKGSVQLPVFITLMQNSIALICIIFVSRIARVWKPLSFIPSFSFDWNIAKKVVPLTICFVLMLTFNNICLKHVQVSTYQVARSSTILFNLIFSYIILNTRFTSMEAVACVLVTMGLVIGALDPSTLSFFGVLTGTLGSVFWAINSVGIKKSLQNLDQWTLLYYNNLLSLPMFIPAILLAGEGPSLFDLPFSFSSISAVWIPILFSGLFAFAMNLAVFYCIKLTSPVTYNIVGTVKACIQSLGGVILLGEIVTTQSVAGILMCVIGSLMYAQAKMKPSTPAVYSIDKQEASKLV